MCEQTAAAGSVHVLYPWGVRMCRHVVVYERFSPQRSNVIPDSCPAPLWRVQWLCLCITFSPHQGGEGAIHKGIPGLTIDSWTSSLWLYLLRACGLDSELLSTGSGSDGLWLPTWAGTLTSDTYLAAREHAAENATQICHASFTLGTTSPACLASHCCPLRPTYLVFS